MSEITTCEERVGLSFFFLSAWAIFLLVRPQDLFPVLSPFRPALVAGILAMFFFVINYGKFQGSPYFNERQVKYYTALLVIMILGIPSSLYPRLSFMSIFAQYINIALFFFIFYKIVDSVNKLSRILLLSCLGFGLYAAFSVAIGSMNTGRLSFSEMFDANDLAFVAMSFIPLNLIFISRDNALWVRLACFGCFGVELLLVLLSGSRGGLLALGVVLALLLLRKSKTIGLHLKAAMVAIFLAFIIFFPINNDRYLSVLEIGQDYNVWDETGRLAIWRSGARTMLTNPFTGVGVGCFAEAIGKDREARMVKSRKWQAPHNIFIQIGTETGIVGLVLFILLSLNVFRIFNSAKSVSALRNLSKISEMGFIGFVGLVISGLFLSQAYSVYWAFYVVLSAVTNQLLLKHQLLIHEQS